MDDVKVGDHLQDHEGNVWTVAELIPDSPSPLYQVRLEQLRPVVEKWAGLDEIGPIGRRYRPVTEATDG